MDYGVSDKRKSLVSPRISIDGGIGNASSSCEKGLLLEIGIGEVIADSLFDIVHRAL